MFILICVLGIAALICVHVSRSDEVHEHEYENEYSDSSPHGVPQAVGIAKILSEIIK